MWKRWAEKEYGIGAVMEAATLGIFGLAIAVADDFLIVHVKHDSLCP